MAKTLFFDMALREFTENTKNKLIFSQCNFYIYITVSFFNLCSGLFSFIAKKSVKLGTI